MNHGSSGSSASKSGFGSKSSLLASKALLGFLRCKTAEGLSPNTRINYEHTGFHSTTVNVCRKSRSIEFLIRQVPSQKDPYDG